MAQILLTTHWTGGDVFPFLHIGKALQARGHHVVLFTHCVYEKKVKDLGLEFVAWDTEEEWMRMQQYFLHSQDPINNYQGLLDLYDHYLTEDKYLKEYHNILPYCQSSEPTVLVARHDSSTAALLAAEQHHIPVMNVYMAPSYMNKLQSDEAIFGQRLTTELNELRTKLQLPSITTWKEWSGTSAQSIALWPEWFSPPGPHWPQGVEPIGFPLGEVSAFGKLSEEVQRFMDEGEPPVLITGGTSEVLGERFYHTAIKACEQIGCRAIVVTEYEELIPADLPPYIRWFPFLNFDALMPQMKAIIHHGGVGTLSCALRAGIPQLVMAYNMDRPFNASLLQQLGVGLFLPLVRWQPRFIANGLQQMFEPAFLAQCHTYAAMITDNPGIPSICRKVEEMVASLELRKD